MKIAFTGMELPEGKIKYHDEYLTALQEKDRPRKIAPFFAELFRDEFNRCEVIVLPKDKLLDLLILDMEKMETRLSRVGEPREKKLVDKCLRVLDQEIPLCDAGFSEEEKGVLRTLAPFSFKPVIQLEGGETVNTVIESALEKADYMFFYTSAPNEAHAWLVKKNSDILSCAAKIHSDLARGFIKGTVVAFEDYMRCHNLNECKSKGVVKLTDRDYIVQPREIIEIRFNI